ncbi:hypothetical protein PM082_023538 [Marasmius tenuissimus]|nr:hypothetical protein PM082_023538 [Marasmius tenuissimus]
MDKERFLCLFDVHSSRLLMTAVPYLVSGGQPRQVEAESYKLDIYDHGIFFRPHKDTSRGENMFATLVVAFPTPHVGGQLVPRHESQKFVFDSGDFLSKSPYHITWVAFFSDIEHEVLPPSPVATE